MDMVSFIHILREWNIVVDCLARWASEHIEGWNVDELGQVSMELYHNLEGILAEDGNLSNIE